MHSRPSSARCSRERHQSRRRARRARPGRSPAASSSGSSTASVEARELRSLLARSAILGERRASAARSGARRRRRGASPQRAPRRRASKRCGRDRVDEHRVDAVAELVAQVEQLVDGGPLRRRDGRQRGQAAVAQGLRDELGPGARSARSARPPRTCAAPAAARARGRSRARRRPPRRRAARPRGRRWSCASSQILPIVSSSRRPGVAAATYPKAPLESDQLGEHPQRQLVAQILLERHARIDGERPQPVGQLASRRRPRSRGRTAAARHPVR